MSHHHHCEPEVLLMDNFDTFNLSNYIVINTDGTVSSSSYGTNICSSPFTATSAGPNDHNKYLVYRNQIFSPEDDRNFVIQTIMTGKQTNICCPPFPPNMVPDPNIDYRLASSGQMNLDLDSLVEFGTIITNNVIYAYYGRAKLDQYTNPQIVNLITNQNLFGTASFINMIPIGGICDFNPCNGCFDVSIAYNRCCNTLTWLLNGNNKLCVEYLGCKFDNKDFLVQDLGGNQFVSKMGRILVGFGTFSLLDAAISPHSTSQCFNPFGLVALRSCIEYFNVNRFGENQCFYVTEPDDQNCRLFGQGANLFLKKQIIYNL